MNSTENHIILSTKKLMVGYRISGKDKVILKDLNLEIHRGELISFIGPNGVGKSTLIRTLSGVQPALDGSVWVGGQNLDEISLKERARNISLVLTNKIEAGNLSVSELVSMGRYPRTNWMGQLTEEDNRVIQKAIDDTRINYISDRKLYELSDGQVQKVMIARALAQDGSLIILDEPTAHLDVNNRIEILQLLKELSRKNNKAILISTHDLDLALQASDRIWLANWNVPVIDGAPEDLILEDKLTETFISDSFIFDKASGRFLFKKEYVDSIRVEGEGIKKYWTEVALQRKGYELRADSELVVRVIENAWQLTRKGEETQFSTIRELLEYL